MKFCAFIRILEAHGFVLDRQRGSHRMYEGVVDGEVLLVVVPCHRERADIGPGLLSSMIRQSRLPKRAFRG